MLLFKILYLLGKRRRTAKSPNMLQIWSSYQLPEKFLLTLVTGNVMKLVRRKIYG